LQSKAYLMLDALCRKKIAPCNLRMTHLASKYTLVSECPRNYTGFS